MGGLLDTLFIEKMELAAKTAHEVNRAYCASIGDHSQLPWDAAPEWQRESCINGVRHLIANPNSTPEESHQSWLTEKENTGWKYGPVKDTIKKEHPCMVPYSELPLEQRTKHYLFGAAVRSIMN